MNRPLGLLCLTALLWAGMSAAEVSREDILFLGEDGRQFTVYKTLRSDIPKRQLYLEPDETVDDFVYIHPDDFETEQSGDGTLLTFEAGSYALMRTGQFSDQQLERGLDGVFTFRSWNGRKLANGHFGKWNSPDPFAYFSYVWVLPGNMELLERRANRDGEWQRQGNTLAWSGKQVNDLTFTVRYRLKQPELPADLPRVTLRQPITGEDARRITLDSSRLFASGSHELTDAGQRLLDELAQKLVAEQPARVIVEGHTDDQPIKPYLQNQYPSNWELSAQRATGVVRYLDRRGLNAAQLEARALGSQRPVASNDTAAGRAKNRRIEILVTRVAPKTATQPVPDSQPEPEPDPKPKPKSENKATEKPRPAETKKKREFSR